MYGNAYDSWCTVFKNCFQLFIGYISLFHVCLPKLSSVLCRLPKANLHLGKLKIFSYDILYPPWLKNFNNFSCIQKNLPNTGPKIFSMVTRRRAIKESSKVANRDWVNNQACSMPHNIHVVSGSFIANDYFPKLIRKIISTNNFSKLIH